MKPCKYARKKRKCLNCFQGTKQVGNEVQLIKKRKKEVTCWFAEDIVHWGQVVLANKPQGLSLYNLNKQIYMPFLHTRPHLTRFLW